MDNARISETRYLDRLMQAASRTEAQRRADSIRTFREELARLESEDILHLTGEQTNALRAHHADLLTELSRRFDIDIDSKARQLSLGMRIASFVGALALAASVFFLFYRLWGFLPVPAQVTILITASIGTFLTTLWLDQRDATGYFVKLAALVAFTCFVLNIVMLGQIFNITPSDAALLPWAGFALLLAYRFDLRLLQTAGILCLIAYMSARTGTWSGAYWISFGERPENFFAAAVVIFLVPRFIDHARHSGFAATYRILGMLAMFLPMLVLANWGNVSYLNLDPDFIEGFYQLFGLVGTAVLIWHGARHRCNDVVNTGVTLFVIFTYTKLFDWWWDALPKYLFFLLMGLIAVLLLMVFKRMRQEAT